MWRSSIGVNSLVSSPRPQGCVMGLVGACICKASSPGRAHITETQSTWPIVLGLPTPATHAPPQVERAFPLLLPSDSAQAWDCHFQLGRQVGHTVVLSTPASRSLPLWVKGLIL